MPTAAASKRLTLALLAFAQLIISIDYNIVYVALPRIGDDLGFSAHTLQWVISAYVVAYGGFLLLGGRASDLLGRRRMFVLGLVLYAVSSLVGGLATAPGPLVAARAVQGLGGALLFPATLSLVNTTFAEGRERNRALSVWAGAGAGGLVLGSLLGGVLTQALGWASVFYVNVPLAAVAVLAAFPLLPADPPAAGRRRFDLPGAFTSTAGTTLVVFALVQGPESGWDAPAVLAAAVAGIVLLAAFVVVEARGADPLMPLRLFGNRNLSTGVAITFLFTAAFGSVTYFVTQYLHAVRGFSALGIGIAFLPPCVAVFAGSAAGGRLLTRLGARSTLLVSLPLGVVGTAWLGLAMTPDASYLALLPGLLILSVGQGITFTTMFAAAATGVPARQQGVASGMASTGQQAGTAVGLAVLVAIADSGLAGRSGEALRIATSDGARTAVLLAAGILAVMIAVALNFRREDRSAPVPVVVESAPEPATTENAGEPAGS
ncbi:MFS transporter [Actinomadura gamaensis]|uniref:MFS transporter n=1 Tax=Actinomadura gamaensis TaxID=1763541 RepID=A0ABV9TW62_9ACTN